MCDHENHTSEMANGEDTKDATKAPTESQSDSVSSEIKDAQKCDEVPMPSGPKTRYEWYQSETHVVVSVLVKNAKKEDLKCDIQEKTLSCTIRLPSGSDYSLELDLCRDIVPDQSQVKILSTRVEIKLKKKEGWRWDKLEDDGVHTALKQISLDQTPAAPDDDPPHKYPSSSHCRHNWDQIEAQIKADEKDEKLEGDAALNQLFQQIYADGSDETRRAMNKSFMESGGTVLSTNWKEIKSQQTECKPPDGMEYKKYT